MKYTRIQKVVRRICDDNIKDINVVKKLISSIQDKQLYCSLLLEKDFQTIDYPKVRIVETGDNAFKYRVFSSRGILVDSEKYEKIRELKVETEIEKEIVPDEIENIYASLDLGD